MFVIETVSISEQKADYKFEASLVIMINLAPSNAI